MDTLEFVTAKLIRNMKKTTAKDMISLANVKFSQHTGESTKLSKLFDAIINDGMQIDMENIFNIA